LARKDPGDDVVRRLSEKKPDRHLSRKAHGVSDKAKTRGNDNENNNVYDEKTRMRMEGNSSNQKPS